MGQLIGILVLVCIAGMIYVMKCENKFVSISEFIKNALSNIDVVQENRYDTLIELYKIVASYAEHEKTTLSEIIANRGVNKSDDKAMGNILNNLFAVAEAYPDLKANTLYNNLIEKLSEQNNEVKMAKMVYNDTVTKYNRLVNMIPSNFVASMFNHTEKQYLEISKDKKQMPSFDDNKGN